MKSKRMQKNSNVEQDKLVELSRTQQSPGEALAEDFRVTTASEAAKMPLPRHGQRGDDARENARLMSEVGQNPQSVSDESGLAQRKEPEDAGKPHSANLPMRHESPSMKKQRSTVMPEDKGKSLESSTHHQN